MVVIVIRKPPKAGEIQQKRSDVRISGRPELVRRSLDDYEHSRGKPIELVPESKREFYTEVDDHTRVAFVPRLDARGFGSRAESRSPGTTRQKATIEPFAFLFAHILGSHGRTRGAFECLLIVATLVLSASITLDDAKPLFLEFQTAGVTFYQPLKTEPWGARTFILSDPDGNLILFSGRAD